jgi:hypothetical protein
MILSAPAMFDAGVVVAKAREGLYSLALPCKTPENMRSCFYAP